MKLPSVRVVEPISQCTTTNLHFILGITIGLLDVLHGPEVNPSIIYKYLPPVGQMEVALVAVAYSDRERVYSEGLGFLTNSTSLFNFKLTADFLSRPACPPSQAFPSSSPHSSWSRLGQVLAWATLPAGLKDLSGNATYSAGSPYTDGPDRFPLGHGHQ